MRTTIIRRGTPPPPIPKAWVGFYICPECDTCFRLDDLVGNRDPIRTAKLKSGEWDQAWWVQCPICTCTFAAAPTEEDEGGES